jgi:hypothetical protein
LTAFNRVSSDQLIPKSKFLFCQNFHFNWKLIALQHAQAEAGELRDHPAQDRVGQPGAGSRGRLQKLSVESRVGAGAHFTSLQFAL